MVSNQYTQYLFKKETIHTTNEIATSCYNKKKGGGRKKIIFECYINFSSKFKHNILDLNSVYI